MTSREERRGADIRPDEASRQYVGVLFLALAPLRWGNTRILPGSTFELEDDDLRWGMKVWKWLETGAVIPAKDWKQYAASLSPETLAELQSDAAKVVASVENKQAESAKRRLRHSADARRGQDIMPAMDEDVTVADGEPPENPATEEVAADG